MRYLVILLLILSACGGGSEKGGESQDVSGSGNNKPANKCAKVSFVGNWTSTSDGNPIVFRSNCTGADSPGGCGLDFTYSADTDNLFAHILSTNGDPGCPPDVVADYVCDYAYPVTVPGFPGEDLLRIKCGDAATQDWYGTQYFRFESEVNS